MYSEITSILNIGLLWIASRVTYMTAQLQIQLKCALSMSRSH